MNIRTVSVKKDILSANSKKAEENRAILEKHHCLMINIMSSPGSGKTSLITSAINRFKDAYGIAVIEGDIASSIDADRISELNVQALQINTGGGCHLDANMVEKALDDLDLDNLDLVFVENVGNLVCTADFDLGAHKNAVILSIPEGDDKPYKYPVIFMEADVVLINKMDVLPYFDFDLVAFPEIMAGLNPSVVILPVSAKSGEGLEEWFLWIEQILNQ